MVHTDGLGGQASTSAQYLIHQRQFLQFCLRSGREALPASPPTVVGFMRDLLDKGRSRSTISKAALSAIATCTDRRACHLRPYTPW